MDSYFIQIIIAAMSSLLGVIAFFVTRYFNQSEKKEDRDYLELIKKIDNYESYKDKDFSGLKIKIDQLEKDLFYKIDSIQKEINSLNVNSARYSERVAALFDSFKSYTQEQNTKTSDLEKKITEFGKVIVKDK